MATRTRKQAQRERRTSTPAAAPATPPRLAWIIVGLAAAGVGLSIALTRLHASAHAGETSFCSISATVDCDRVATSSYSVVLGIPVAVWGILGFAAIGALAASGLRARRPHAAWPAGLLVLLSGVAVAASLVLAGISKLAIGAWCLLCAGAWIVALATLVTAWRSLPAAGLGAALRADWEAVRARPGTSAALVAAAVAIVGALAAAYPRYWVRPAAPAAARPAASPAPPVSPGAPTPPAASPASPLPPGAELIVYSDYLCPFCARAHEQERAFRATRPDLRFTKRHFPLDSTCNTRVATQMHPGACELARAAICAEAQGRFDDMDDALYRRQGSPVDAARRLGLDVGRFQACLTSREPDARLRRDIALGVQGGINALPSYVAEGRVFVGQLPPELLGPR
jgi:uncharacterized membrane protein